MFALDAATKYLTQQYLPLRDLGYYPYGGIAVFKDVLGIEFSLVHATNKGAAWGILGGYQGWLIGLRIAIVLGVMAYFFLSNRHPYWRIPLMLIIAGALGNIVDYFFYGHVIDMFHFILWGYDYPVFNVADASIFIGICSLFLVSSFEKTH